MSYTIHYTPQDDYRYPVKEKRNGKFFKSLLLTVLVLSFMLWIGISGMPDFMIPGDPEVTKSAVAEMIAQMRSGMPMEEAVTVFYRQVIYGADA